jgi:hypothetical protein
MMEEEQLEVVILVDQVNLMVLETRVLVVNPVNPVNLILMVPKTRALINLEIGAPIADHNLYRSILSDHTLKRSPPYLK